MSKAEILAELPNLKAEERRQVFQRLCELQEDDLLHGVGPTEEEKNMLDEALTRVSSATAIPEGRGGSCGIVFRILHAAGDHTWRLR